MTSRRCTLENGKEGGARRPALTDPSVARFATFAALLAAQPTQKVYDLERTYSVTFSEKISGNIPE